MNSRPPDSPTESDPDAFARQAEAPSPGLLREFVDFLRHNRKWWLIPILLVFGLLALVALFSGSPVAPFIYPFF